MESIDEESVKTMINVRVVDYCLTGEAQQYDSHTFSIQVWSEGEQLTYSIQRNYVAFCDLHYRLTSKFTRSTFPTFCLDGYKEFEKKVSDKGISGKIMKTFQRRSSVSADGSTADSAEGDLRSSVVGGTSGGGDEDPEDGTGDGSSLKPLPKLTVPSSSTEVIPQRKDHLTEYLQALLRLPEVLSDSVLRLFLDEESPSGRVLTRREVSDVDVALVGEEPSTVTVSRGHTWELEARPGDVVVWSFATKKKDIAFSVLTGGRALLPYRRYDCHEASIRGMCELKEGGKVALVWDNTYSKFRNKMLTFVAKCVNKSDFDIFRRIAFEKARDRHRFEMQRVVLRRTLDAATEQLLASLSLGPFRVDIKGPGVALAGMEDELVRLRDEVVAATARSASAEATVTQLRADGERLQARADERAAEAAASVERERLTQADAELMKGVNAALQLKLDAATANVVALEATLLERDSEAEGLRERLRVAETEAADVQQQLAKHRAEKKQLKAYAKKLVEEEQQQNDTIEDLRRQVASLGNTIEQSEERVAAATQEREDAVCARAKAEAMADAASAAAATAASQAARANPPLDAQVKGAGAESLLSPLAQQTLTPGPTPVWGVNKQTTGGPAEGADGVRAVAAVGWEVTDGQERPSFDWASEPLGLDGEEDDETRSELAAFVLTRPLSQRLLYLNNSVGF